MKKRYLLFILLCGSMPFLSESCPTCQGRIEKESPPFFSDEFYKAPSESMDYIYQKLLAEQDSDNEGIAERES